MYKTCKHIRDKRCRECPCGAWCSNDDCTCGCHDTPTYTMADFMSAQWAANETSTSFKLVQDQQSAERNAAQLKLSRLNAELAPFAEKQKEAEVKLRDMKQRLLGPWDDQGNRNDNSYMLIAGGTDKCWHNRVWLCIAGCEGYQWRVRIQYVDSPGNREWVLGPPKGPRKEDLAANKLKAEKYIIKMGFILGDR